MNYNNKKKNKPFQSYALCLLWQVSVVSGKTLKGVISVSDNAASKSMSLFDTVAEEIKGKATIAYVDCR